MAKNSMFDYRKTDGSPSRNVFDLSRRDIFGINIGELLPVFCQEVVPGDKIKVECADLVRVMPLVSSPFARMKQHIDFYFVPYEQLWSQWLNFVNMKDDVWSTGQKGRLYVPNVLGSMLNTAISSSNTKYDVLGYPCRGEAMKLLDMLGYGSTYWNKGNSSSASAKQFNSSDRYNVFRLAAYNKIWYDFYRQKYYDDGTINLPNTYSAASLFNFDDLQCTSPATAQVSSYQLNAMLQMRYRCYKKDLYTGLLPSTQQGNVSAVLSSSAMQFVDFDGDPISLTYAANNLSFDNMVPNFSNDSQAQVRFEDSSSVDHRLYLKSSSGGFDILELRRAQAIQKWRENALRAGNRVEDSQRVRFGKKPYYHNDVHPAFLGSVSSPLQISDVNVTAQTGAAENGSVGDYVGKGMFALNGNAFTFDTGDNGDYGIIMGIMSILPDMEYNARGVDYANCLLEVEDFYQPEYDKLGFNVVPERVFNNFLTGYLSDARGYAPNYWYYKQAYDKVHGEFMNDQDMSGNMQVWCAPNYYAGSSQGVNLADFYCDKRLFNSMFALSPSFTFDSQDDFPVEYNNFAVDLYMEVKAIRPMSILGLPQI